jgi:hypothetical protein
MMTANALDLTWLNAVKQRAEVGITPAGIVAVPDDTEIQAAITGFSQHILNFTGQGSLNSVVTLDEIYDGNGNDRMPLASWPIRRLRSVAASGVAIQLSITTLDWGVFIDRSQRSIALRGGNRTSTTFPYPNYSRFGGFTKGLTFPRGTGNLQIVYDAGYDPLAIVNEVDAITTQTITLQRSPWVSDQGVKFYPSLVPLTLVDSAPAAGEYAVDAGLYVFNVADEGSRVAVSYSVNAAPFDLEYAVRCVVAINYKRKGWQDQGSRVVNAGGSSATTAYRNWAWPPEYDDVFENYKRLAVPA